MGYFVPVQMGYLCTGQEGLHVFNSGLNGSIVFQSRAHNMFEEQIASVDCPAGPSALIYRHSCLRISSLNALKTKIKKLLDAVVTDRGLK